MFIHKLISLLILFLGFALAHVAQLEPRPDTQLTQLDSELEFEETDHDAGMLQSIASWTLPPTSTDLGKDKSAFIRGQVDRVSTETSNLGAALARWDGTAIDAVHISSANEALVQVVLDCAKQISSNPASPKLNLPSALRLKKPIEALVKLTDGLVGDFIEQEKRFKDMNLQGQVRANFESLKKASATMNEAVVGKVPRVARRKARKVGEIMKSIFDKGIKAFN